MSKYMTSSPMDVENPAINESVDINFIAFLDSLVRSEKDKVLIENAKKGYITCMSQNADKPKS